MGKRTGVKKSKAAPAKAPASTESAFKGGAIALGVLWLITAVLALSGILVEDTWALTIGVVVGLLGLPLAVWTFKQDPAA